jgi:hypothetical protein
MDVIFISSCRSCAQSQEEMDEHAGSGVPGLLKGFADLLWEFAIFFDKENAHCGRTQIAEARGQSWRKARKGPPSWP